MPKTILHIIARLPRTVLVQESPQLLASVRTTARSRPPIYFFGDSLGLLGFGGGRQRETIEASLVFEEEEEEEEEEEGGRKRNEEEKEDEEETEKNRKKTVNKERKLRMRRYS